MFIFWYIELSSCLPLGVAILEQMITIQKFQWFNLVQIATLFFLKILTSIRRIFFRLRFLFRLFTVSLMAPFVARWPRKLCWGWNICSTLRRHGECLVNIHLLFWISIRYSRLKRPLYIMSARSLTFANQGNYFDLIKHFLLSNTVLQDVGGGLNSVAPEHYSDNLSFSLKEIYLIYWKPMRIRWLLALSLWCLILNQRANILWNILCSTTEKTPWKQNYRSWYNFVLKRWRKTASALETTLTFLVFSKIFSCLGI